MPSKSHSRRNEKRDRRDRYDDSDDDGHDRRGVDSSSRNRRKERERREKSKKRDRDSDGSDVDKRDRDGRGSRSKHRHRDHHHSSKGKSSNKKRKKSSRDRSARYSDDDSDRSSDYGGRSNKKRKKEKKSSKSRHEKKDKKSEKNLSTRKPDKSRLVFMGQPLGRQPDSKLNVDEDYFSYHQEFWIYLFREEGICFNDLDTEESHAAFARFAKQYNAGMLEEPYYSRNFPNEVIEESKTTKHSWSFKTTQTERKGLGDLQKGVRQQTEYNSKKENRDITDPNSIHSIQVRCLPAASVAPAQRQGPTPEERLKERRADRRLKEHVRLTHEELMGGPKDLKERRLEKKREHSARIHGAHRDNEGEAAGMELSDATLFGDDGNGIDSFRERNRQSKERRDERKKNRFMELKAKEDERQKNMLKMLGLENLQGREKLKIAPRK